MPLSSHTLYSNWGIEYDDWYSIQRKLEVIDVYRTVSNYDEACQPLKVAIWLFREYGYRMHELVLALSTSYLAISLRMMYGCSTRYTINIAISQNCCTDSL